MTYLRKSIHETLTTLLTALTAPQHYVRSDRTIALMKQGAGGLTSAYTALLKNLKQGESEI